MDASSPDARRAEAVGRQVSGRPERVGAALPELAALLERAWAADDDDTLDAVVCALGQASDVRAAALLLPPARAGHHDAGVRTSLAQALGTGVDAGPVRSQVVAALVTLSADPVDDVRDWACFALGSNEADDPASRDALARRLDDEHADTRAEALLALARTGDARALAAVHRVLGGDGSIGLLDLEAAAALADPSLLPGLEDLARAWAEDHDEHAAAVDLALRRCRPDAAVAAQRVETELADASRRRQRAGLQCGRLEGSWPRSMVVDLDADGVPLEGQVPLRLWETGDDPARADLGQMRATFIERTTPPSGRQAPGTSTPGGRSSVSSRTRPASDVGALRRGRGQFE